MPTGHAVRVCLSADAVAHLRPQLEQLMGRIYRDINQQEFDNARDVLARILNNVTSIEKA